jgi:hypothetical protein
MEGSPTRAGAHSHLETGGIYEVGEEVQEGHWAD